MFSPSPFGTKVCATCGKERSLWAFAWRDEQLSGLLASCRTCVNLKAVPFEHAFRQMRRVGAGRRMTPARGAALGRGEGAD